MGSNPEWDSTTKKYQNRYYSRQCNPKYNIETKIEYVIITKQIKDANYGSAKQILIFLGNNWFIEMKENYWPKLSYRNTKKPRRLDSVLVSVGVKFWSLTPSGGVSFQKVRIISTCCDCRVHYRADYSDNSVTSSNLQVSTQQFFLVTVA